MVVRPATPDDAEAIERIRVRGWQVGYRHLYPPEKLDALELDWTRWARRIERPPTGWATFVAEARGRTVGFASIGPSRDEHGVGELYAIYVDPDQWSRGVGRALIARAESRLAEAFAQATLWVLEDNSRARRFYEAAGWHADGARQRVERLGVSPAEVRYRKRLVFPV
jgi:GNAT superfamily N-acetyltransferase